MNKNWTTPVLLLGQIENLQPFRFLVLKAKKQSGDSNIYNNVVE